MLQAKEKIQANKTVPTEALNALPSKIKMHTPLKMPFKSEDTIHTPMKINVVFKYLLIFKSTLNFKV